MTRKKSASQIPLFGGWERSVTELVEHVHAKHQVLCAGITTKIQINQRFTGASDGGGQGEVYSTHPHTHLHKKYC